MDFMSMDFDKAENIFFFINSENESMEIVLNYDTIDKFYYTLLTKSFAAVIDVPNEHSMVFTNPKQPNYFHQKIPAFDIKYIEDCFKIKDFPDPTKYLIKNTSHSNYTKDDIFDCWLHKTKSWSDLFLISENKNSKSKTPIKSSSNSISQVTSSKDDFDNFMSPTRSKKDSPSKRTRLPYSHKEEMNIVKYIINNNHAFDVKGRAMWQQMEHDNVCRHRTWQSMKERYLKAIRYDLNSGNHRFPFIEPKDLKLLRQGLNIEQMDEDEKNVIKCKFTEERFGSFLSDSDSS